MSTKLPQVRGERARLRVLDAAREVLVERGVAGVSIDSVAQRAGVARTTVYRHFDDVSTLVTAALDAHAPGGDAPKCGEVIRDAAALLEALARAVSEGPWGELLPTVLAESDRDPAVAGQLSEFVAARRSALVAVLARGQAQGRLVDTTDIDTVADALAGIIYYRRLLRRRPVRPEATEHLVATVLGPYLVHGRL